MIEDKITSNINNIHYKDLENRKLFGLWIYLMSDCIMFAVLFAVYAIVSSSVSVDLINKNVFDLSFVFLETLFLLLSSLSCGFTIIAMKQKKNNMIIPYLIVTFCLGFLFLCMELNEFYNLILKNFRPDQHAFFSIFFTLVGTHGIHIFCGLILILSIIYQIKKLGLTPSIRTRILCFSMFWHFLDIIWICVFTFIYLKGAI